MKKFKNIHYLATAFALCLALAACNDDETYDFPGDPNNIVYTPDESKAYKLVQTPISTVCTLDSRITAKCKDAATGDIKVTVAVDNSLVDEYNHENNTNYVVLPSEALVIENTTLTIPDGSRVSADTTKVSLTDNADILASLNATDGYIIPIRMTSVDGNAKAAKSVTSISYLTVTVTYDNVNHDADLTEAKGTPVEDQSEWTVNNTQLSAMLDGNSYNNGYLTSDSDIEIIVDMGKEYKFDAIVAKYGFSWGSYSYEYGTLYANTELSISNDGNSWTNIATIEKTRSYILFYAPHTARYIKILAPVTNFYGRYYALFQCGYFNVYAI
jgi:hypothetical protein